jgi:NAD(P)-dependent dehydrogenase (short-subunit alcohol dehydrogenase family)
MNDMFCMNNKVVLITGGSGYLGKAMCEILCEYGATLIVASRNHQKNLILKKTINEKYKCNIEIVDLDISDRTSIDECISRVIEDFGRIDVLINNSYYGAGSELLTMKDSDWTKGIEGSINSTFRITQTVLKNMIENKSGKIINIASMYGIVAPDVTIYEENNYYNPANYGIGKAGIIQFTKYIAAVYGKFGITCNAISPGPFPNNEVQKDTIFMKNLSKKVPLGRIGVPDDLKGIIILLSSDASNYINGTNILVDGGWTIW